MENEFERTINASDLQEWIMNVFPDWCVGDIMLIFDHIDEMPSAQPDSIPLDWIKHHIEWLNNLDDGFARLSIIIINTMVEKWKELEAKTNDIS